MSNTLWSTVGHIFLLLVLLIATGKPGGADKPSEVYSEQMWETLGELLDVFDESATVDFDAACKACQNLAKMKLDPRQRRLCAIVATQLLRRRAEVVPHEMAIARGIPAKWILADELASLLAALRDPVAIPHLQEYYLQLGGKDGRAPAVQVARAIRALGGEVPVIERKPEGEDYWPSDSVLSLSELKQVRAERILLHLQVEGWDTTKYHSQSAQAIYELGELRTQEAIPYLLEQLDPDTPEFMRIQAILALGKIGDLQAVEPLLVFLRSDQAGHPDASAYLRREAIYALTQMGVESALPDIIACLDDPEAEVRIRAVQAIRKMGDPEDIATLEKLRNDEDERVRNLVERALGTADKST